MQGTFSAPLQVSSRELMTTMIPSIRICLAGNNVAVGPLFPTSLFLIKEQAVPFQDNFKTGTGNRVIRSPRP